MLLSLNLAVAIARVSTAQGSTVHWRVSVGAATKIIIAWQQHLIVGEGSTGSAPFRLLFVVERQHRDDEYWDDVTALHVLDSSMTACMHTVMQSRDLIAAAFLWAALRVRRDQHEDNIGSSKHYARPRFDDRL